MIHDFTEYQIKQEKPLPEGLKRFRYQYQIYKKNINISVGDIIYDCNFGWNSLYDLEHVLSSPRYSIKDDFNIYYLKYSGYDEEKELRRWEVIRQVPEEDLSYGGFNGHRN